MACSFACLTVLTAPAEVVLEGRFLNTGKGGMTHICPPANSLAGCTKTHAFLWVLSQEVKPRRAAPSLDLICPSHMGIDPVLSGSKSGVRGWQGVRLQGFSLGRKSWTSWQLRVNDVGCVQVATMWQRLAAYSMIYRSGSGDVEGSKGRSSAPQADTALGGKVGAPCNIACSRKIWLMMHV